LWIFSDPKRGSEGRKTTGERWRIQLVKEKYVGAARLGNLHEVERGLY